MIVSFKWITNSSCLNLHCVKSVRIPSYSGPHFPAFGLNTERYEVSLRIQSECGKMWTRITANTDTFYTVLFLAEGSHKYKFPKAYKKPDEFC